MEASENRGWRHTARADRTTEIPAGAKERASEEGEEASAQAGHLLGKVRTYLEEQAAAGAQRVGENLRRFGEQGVALTDGRPQYAPDIGDFVRHMADTLLEAADLADAVADDVRWRGIGRSLQDIGGVARRRPRLFVLVSATAALFAVAPVPPDARARADGDREQEDRSVRDQLEPAALDALLRAMWPGDVGRRSPAGRGQRPVGSGQKRQLATRHEERIGPLRNERSEGGGSVIAERAQSAPHRAERAKKKTTRAAPEVEDGPQSRARSVKKQAQVATARGKAETVEAARRVNVKAKPSPGVEKNPKRAKGTSKSQPRRTAAGVAKAPVNTRNACE